MTALLALLLAVSILVGCSGGMVTDVKNTAAPPELMLTVEEPQPAEPVYVVELEVLEDTILAEDGTELLHYRFETPRMDARSPDASPLAESEECQAILTAFNEQFEDWVDSEGLAELVKAAEEDLAWRKGEDLAWYGPYELELDCDIYRTEDMVSISGVYYRNTGGAHPSTYPLAWNFDLTTGAFFRADELASDSQDFREEVRDAILWQANLPLEDGTVPAEGYWEGYEEIVENWHDYTVTFDDLGMTVSFAPYELACYAAGAQTFRMVYEDLLPHLSDHAKTILDLEYEE